MLQDELIELLGSGTPRVLAENLPVIQNRETEWVAFQQKETENGGDASSPFTFKPERIRVATEDEYFEVAC